MWNGDFLSDDDDDNGDKDGLDVHKKDNTYIHNKDNMKKMGGGDSVIFVGIGAFIRTTC